MAFCIDSGIEKEIRAVFNKDEQIIPKRQNEFRQLFRKHSNLTIKHLKRKWNIISLEAYIESNMIPRGLRERIMPADHLHNERFLKKWTEESVKHGLHMIGLIVEEEKIQLNDIEIQLKESVELLNEYQDLEDFKKFNERIRKEDKDFQKEQKIGKQKKFQRDTADFETGNILDLERKRGRSRSRNRFQKQDPRNHSKEGGKNVTFLKKTDKTTLKGIMVEKRNEGEGEIERTDIHTAQEQNTSKMGNSTLQGNRVTTRLQKTQI